MQKYLKGRTGMPNTSALGPCKSSGAGRAGVPPRFRGNRPQTADSATPTVPINASEADLVAIWQTASDYIDGWYSRQHVICVVDVDLSCYARLDNVSATKRQRFFRFAGLYWAATKQLIPCPLSAPRSWIFSRVSSRIAAWLSRTPQRSTRSLSGHTAGSQSWVSPY